jgi:hypothetical protein
MEITYKGTVIKESTNPYVNRIYPIGSKVEVDQYWFKCGWLPILNSVIDSAILDLKNVKFDTSVDVFY